MAGRDAGQSAPARRANHHDPFPWPGTRHDGADRVRRGGGRRPGVGRHAGGPGRVPGADRAAARRGLRSGAAGRLARRRAGGGARPRDDRSGGAAAVPLRDRVRRRGRATGTPLCRARHRQAPGTPALHHRPRLSGARGRRCAAQDAAGLHAAGRRPSPGRDRRAAGSICPPRTKASCPARAAGPPCGISTCCPRAATSFASLTRTSRSRTVSTTSAAGGVSRTPGGCCCAVAARRRSPSCRAMAVGRYARWIPRDNLPDPVRATGSSACRSPRSSSRAWR